MQSRLSNTKGKGQPRMRDNLILLKGDTAVRFAVLREIVVLWWADENNQMSQHP